MSPERVSPLEESLRDPLPGVKKQLGQEYEGFPEELIEDVAKHALDSLSSARVKEFVPILAWATSSRGAS